MGTGIGIVDVHTLKITAVESPTMNWSIRGATMVYFVKLAVCLHGLDDFVTYHSRMQCPAVPYHAGCRSTDHIPDTSESCLLDRKIGQVVSRCVIYCYTMLARCHAIIVVQYDTFSNKNISKPCREIIG